MKFLSLVLFLSIFCFGEFLETDSILGNSNNIQFNDTTSFKRKPVSTSLQNFAVFDSSSNKLKTLDKYSVPFSDSTRASWKADSALIARRVDISGVTENYHTKRSGDSLSNSFVYDNDTSTIMTEKLFLNDVETACQVGGGCDSIVTIDNKEIKKVYVGDLIGTHSIIKGIGTQGYLSRWVNSDSIGNSYTKDSSNLIGGNDTIATLSGATLKKQSLDSLIEYKKIHTGQISDSTYPVFNQTQNKYIDGYLSNNSSGLVSGSNIYAKNSNIYSYGGTDSAYLDYTNGIQLRGAATQWKDIRFNIQSGLPGATTPATVSISGTMFKAKAFDVGDEVTAWPSEVYHGFYVSSDSAEFHLHYMTAGTDESERTIAGRIFFAIIDTMDTLISKYDSLDFEDTIPAFTGTYVNIYADIANISTVDYGIRGGRIVWLGIRRIASSGTEPSDDPILEMVGMHVEMSAIGSVEEVP